MHFLALASAFFSLTAMPQLLAASPLKVGGNGDVCPEGFFSVPQCCSIILGVGLDCVSPFPTPNNSVDFDRLRGWEREYTANGNTAGHQLQPASAPGPLMSWRSVAYQLVPSCRSQWPESKSILYGGQLGGWAE
ncbi:hypothetical protein GGX14DRAFT_393440 [Mycena pura]|uniref:Hydrophobin n=1 Tax=Mycena pura TaxID=153505 RepID=A0AAD6VKS6_9AGAR|nr:hypothetical protein GGX14DRAFT_393440 [Mycena pura]